MSDELPEYAERVLEVAEAIPPGRVMTYGDVAEWLGEGGPRQVGRVMALYGGAVPWWRVIRADGVLLPGHELRALGHYRAEGTPLREAGRATEGHLPRVDMKRARWDGAGDALADGEGGHGGGGHAVGGHGGGGQAVGDHAGGDHVAGDHYAVGGHMGGDHHAGGGAVGGHGGGDQAVGGGHVVAGHAGGGAGKAHTC
ncbi:MGMT family protein [Streptomyces sp. SYSU K21746]